MEEGALYETINHPALGDIRWESPGWWYTIYRQSTGKSVEVILEPDDEKDRHAFLNSSAPLFQWALENESRLLTEAIRSKLLELFNVDWRQEDEAKLTGEELANRLSGPTFHRTESPVLAFELSYSAGDLFGGHTVCVEVDREMRMREPYLAG